MQWNKTWRSNINDLIVGRNVVSKDLILIIRSKGITGWKFCDELASL
ncbi:MAG: hypothetical protein ACTS6G_00105 [Candidatus Hodgkinia cicadicola]